MQSLVWLHNIAHKRIHAKKAVVAYVILFLIRRGHNIEFAFVNAHAGSRTRVTSMGGLYDAATLHALLNDLHNLNPNKIFVA